MFVTLLPTIEKLRINPYSIRYRVRVRGLYHQGGDDQNAI